MSIMHLGDPLVSLELIAVVRIAIAGGLGALIGLERSLAGKHAGMRTYALVAMGSALFVVGGELMGILSYGGALDPSRIAAAVIMGIGFIGSGLALFHKDIDRPGEITTAAGVWVAAGVGMVAGFGFYTLAIAATALTLAIFYLLMQFENLVRNRYPQSRESKEEAGTS